MGNLYPKSDGFGAFNRTSIERKPAYVIDRLLQRAGALPSNERQRRKDEKIVRSLTCHSTNSQYCGVSVLSAFQGGGRIPAHTVVHILFERRFSFTTRYNFGTPDLLLEPIDCHQPPSKMTPGFPRLVVCAALACTSQVASFMPTLINPVTASVMNIFIPKARIEADSSPPASMLPPWDDTISPIIAVKELQAAPNNVEGSQRYDTVGRKSGGIWRTRVLGIISSTVSVCLAFGSEGFGRLLHPCLL